MNCYFISSFYVVYIHDSLWWHSNSFLVGGNATPTLPPSSSPSGLCGVTGVAAGRGRSGEISFGRGEKLQSAAPPPEAASVDRATVFRGLRRREPAENPKYFVSPRTHTHGDYGLWQQVATIFVRSQVFCSLTFLRSDLTVGGGNLSQRFCNIFY